MKTLVSDLEQCAGAVSGAERSAGGLRADRARRDTDLAESLASPLQFWPALYTKRMHLDVTFAVLRKLND